MITKGWVRDDEEGEIRQGQACFSVILGIEYLLCH